MNFILLVISHIPPVSLLLTPCYLYSFHQIPHGTIIILFDYVSWIHKNSSWSREMFSSMIQSLLHKSQHPQLLIPSFDELCHFPFYTALICISLPLWSSMHNIISIMLFTYKIYIHITFYVTSCDYESTPVLSPLLAECPYSAFLKVPQKQQPLSSSCTFILKLKDPLIFLSLPHLVSTYILPWDLLKFLLIWTFSLNCFSILSTNQNPCLSPSVNNFQEDNTSIKPWKLPKWQDLIYCCKN